MIDTSRLYTLIYNAIIIAEDQEWFHNHQEMLEEIGITEEEYKEIMKE